jgi:heptosyltransferase III
MKILIMKFRNIGDVALVTPLLENIKNHYEGAMIDLAINKECAPLLATHSGINKIITYDRKELKSKSLFSRLAGELAFAYKIRKERYDIVINTTGGERGAWLAYISKAPTRVGIVPKKGIFAKIETYTHTFAPTLYRHIVDINLDSLRTLGLKIKTKNVWLEAGEDANAKVNAILKQNKIESFVHIHPVSRWLFKCTSDELIAKIIDYIELEKGIRVVVTASNDAKEADKLFAILSFCKSKPLTLVGALTLEEMIALSAKAKIFIGVDSAPMHIAASQNIPVIALFGPSGVFNWGAWDNDVYECTYTARNGTQKMGKHTMIQLDLNCIPCGSDGCEGTKISDCLMTIPFENVKIEIDEKL